MWKCTCGEENDDSIKFCPNCGTRQDSDDDNDEGTAAEGGAAEAETTTEEKDDSLEDGKDTEKKEDVPNSDSIAIVRSTSTWTCSCGEKNPGKSGMCRACGKSSFDKDGISSPSLGTGGLEAPKVGFFPEKKKGFFSSVLSPAETYAPSSAPSLAPVPAPTAVSGWICACGSTNTEESNFCLKCGRPNPSARTAVPAPAPAVPASPVPATVPVSEVYPAPASESAVTAVADTTVPSPVVEKEPDIKLPMTTSSGFEGKEITEYIDVVCGSDMYTTGGFANCIQYSYSFEQAKKDLAKKAHELGADAVISIQTTVFSPQNSFFLVSVTGTAVKLKKDDSEENKEE